MRYRTTRKKIKTPSTQVHGSGGGRASESGAGRKKTPVLSLFINIGTPVLLTAALAGIIASERGLLDSKEQSESESVTKLQKPDTRRPPASSNRPHQTRTEDNKKENKSKPGETFAADKGESPASSEMAISADVPTEPANKSESSKSEQEETEKPRRNHLTEPLLSPASRRIIFRAGALDGLPKNKGGFKLSGHEYRCLSDDNTEVLKLKADSEFTYDLPQNLMPGQSIVVELPEFEKQKDYLFRALACRGSRRRSLRVLFNGHPVYNRRLLKKQADIQALLPAAWCEEYQNTITLINAGKSPLAFDAWWIEEAAPLREKLFFTVSPRDCLPAALKKQLSRQPAASRTNTEDKHHLSSSYPSRQALRNLTASVQTDEKLPEKLSVEWPYDPSHIDFDYQEDVIRGLFEKTLGYFANGGDHLQINHINGIGKFYSPLNGKPYPSAFGLQQLAYLFEGSRARRLFANITPASDNKPLPELTWQGVMNTENCVSFLICRGVKGWSPDRFQITASVPWHGESYLSVVREVIPDKVGMRIPPYRMGSGPYKRTCKKTKQKVTVTPTSGNRGLFKYKTSFRESVLLRLYRKPENDDVTIRSIDPSAACKGEQTEDFIKKEAEVTRKDPARYSRRRVFPASTSFFQRLCSYYSIEARRATRGSIGKAGQVTPFHGESIFLTVDYADAAKGIAEGIFVNGGFLFSGPDSQFSFWVYPHVQTKTEGDGKKTAAPDTVHLLVVIGKSVYRASLKPGRWQRVVCPLGNAGGNDRRHNIIVRTSRNWSEHHDSEKVTFELNAVSALQSPQFPVAGKMRYQDDGKKLQLIILGKPGFKTDFQHRFQNAVAINRIRQWTRDGAVTAEHTYKEESQCLTIEDITFPDKLEDRVAKLLPGKAVELCRKQNMTPVLFNIFLSP